MHKKNKGFLLLEILISLGVLAILSLGLFSLYDRAQQDSKKKEMATLVAYIDKESRVFFANRDYTKFNNNTLIMNRIVPFSNISGVQIRHPYGGPMTSGVRNDLGANPLMHLDFNGIANHEDCVDLSLAADSRAFQIDIFVNGTNVGSPKSMGGALNKNLLGQFCSALSPGSTGTVRVTLPE